MVQINAPLTCAMKAHNLFILLFTCTLFSLACTSCNKKASTPVEVSASIFYNHDSLAYYAERAYLHDDPKGLFVTGAAAYLRHQDPQPFDSLGLTTVRLDEAAIMLLHAAELGSEDARALIHCLDANDSWHHSLPETK